MNLDLAARDGVTPFGVVLLGVVGFVVLSKLLLDLLWSSF